MTILKVAGVLFLLMIASMDALACSCENYGQPRKDAKEYYTKKFKGAIFTGTIEFVKHYPPTFEGGGLTDSELTIIVDKYWRGVSTPTMLVVVPGPSSACWFDWKVGQEAFFIAASSKGTNYYAGCDLANWKPSNSNATLDAYATKLLGKPKSFPKPK